MIKILVLLGYIVMVFVNYLANALPIGGVTTGEASDAFANLFTPAGVTFSIWGFIYLALLGYTVYQFGIGQKYIPHDRKKVFAKVNKYFLITSLLNSAWVFAWHYGVIWLSVLIMIGLLHYLIKIANVVNKGKYTLTETLLIRVPFSVYFGWITVATIANITVFLVSIGWDGFGLSDTFWTVSVLLIGAGIGTFRMVKDKNVYYGLVLVWAYAGIWLKHTSLSGFNGQFPSIITTTIVCCIVYIAAIAYVLYKAHIRRIATH